MKAATNNYKSGSASYRCRAAISAITKCSNSLQKKTQKTQINTNTNTILK